MIKSYPILKKIVPIIFLIFSVTAFSQIAQRGTATTATSTGTSLTINKPAGIAVGDIMIANISESDNNALSGNVSNIGWTVIDSRTLGANNMKGTVLYKTADAADLSATNYIFTLSTGTDSASGAIIAFSGVDASNPFDVTPGTILVRDSNSLRATSITTVTANAAIIMLGQVGNNRSYSNWLTVAPGNLNLIELYEVLHNSGQDSSVGGAWGIKVTPGATGNGNATLSDSERNGGILLALRPYTGPPTSPYTFTSSGTFTVPSCVTSITVEAWGGGGGTRNNGSSRRGGGGGGAYASSTLTVTPGTTYTVTVGNGGTPANNTGNAGGDTSFGALVVAVGGKGGSDNGGLGGLFSDNTGNIRFSGGNGANRGTNSNDKKGGGGGGSAFTYANGNNGAVTAGGNGTGNGGNGGNDNQSGTNGFSPGGGGGGRGDDGSNAGAGADGQVIISWTSNAPIANNTFDFTTGNYGTISTTAAENLSATLTAPAGKYFMYVDFASYGTPTGTAPNFAIGGCHATSSQSISEGYLFGNNTAIIPATNAVFGDPCVGTVKILNVQASYATPICYETSPGLISGTMPTGGTGSYAYLWESSTTSATAGFGPAIGTNNAQNYTPPTLTQTTWYRRTVTSGGCSNVSAVFQIQVNASIVVPTITAGGPLTFCSGGSVTLTSSAGTSYLWSTGATTASINVTAGGNYTVSVTNASGCQSAASTATVVTVNALPLAPTVGIITHPTCSLATGSVVLSGLPTGNWTINPGAITGTGASATISGLASATYNFTVTNAAGCTSTASANVVINAQPAPPTITPNKVDETCPASNNGSISPVISGGLSNVRYIKLTQKYVNADAWQQVAEIEAFEIFTGTNVALASNGASATASSNYQNDAPNYGPQKAIDGNLTNIWHSNSTNTDEWIKVDLASAKNIDYLRIYNRSSCCWFRGQNMLLELFDASNNLVYSKTVNLWEGVDAAHYIDVNVLDVSWADSATTLNRTGLDTGTYTLNYADAAGCSLSSPINISSLNAAPATPGAITGTSTQFPLLTGQTYSIAAVPNATTYNWTVPTGWSITAGAGTTAITVTTGNEGDNGNITVSAENACGTNGAVSTLAVTVIASKIDFDGTDDYVDFGDNHDLTGNFTLEAWVLQESTTTTGTIISKRDASATNKRGYHLVLKNDKPNLTWYDNSGSIIINIISPKSITNNKWYHIAATNDGAIAKLYVDGVEVTNGSPSAPPINGTEKFIIGAMYDSNAPTVPTSYFNGFIDEVRVWDVALSKDQIREMMNQRIIQNGTAVKGRTIPLDITEGLLWTNLMGYYPLSDDYTANDKSGNAVKINGTPKNIATNQPNTAPLPYKSTSNGNWDTSGTWLNGTVQNIPNSIGIDVASTYVDWNIVETSDNVNTTRNIRLLGLKNNVNELSINADHSLEISNYLLLNGKIDLEGESQLLQDMGSVLDPLSTGSIEIDQQGEGNKYRYNYWSMPVYTLNDGGGNYTTISASLRNGTNPSSPGAIAFTSGYDGSLSPFTLSTFWMYKFVDSGLGYSAWDHIGSTENLYTGQGVSMKGPKNPVVPPAISEQNYVFVGKPNNGTIELNVNAGNEYLVGNPYPSAIDAEQFLTDNGPSGTNIIGVGGALRFWEHYGGDTHNLAGYQGGYATYNLAGGTSATSNLPVAGVSNLGSSVKGAPKRFIPVGQAFFVDGHITGKIQFNNGQRIFVKESDKDVNGDSISVFMKSNNTKAKTVNTRLSDLRPKFRIGFDAPKISHRQLLLTIDERATQDVDWGFDAEIYEVFADDMYWMLNNKKYVIQGTNEVGLISEVPLGIQLSKTGMVTVKIDALENVDDDTAVYLKDKLTGESFNMREKPVQLNLTAGKYADRFVIVFKIQKLVAEDVVAEVLIPATAQPVIEGIHVFMNNAMGELQIKNNSTNEIIGVSLTNTAGQRVNFWNTNLNQRTISLPVSTATGVYLVQITTENGTTNKKIVVD